MEDKILTNYLPIEMTNDIERIQRLPNTIGDIHESCYKSFHVMNLISTMLERGDSKETILMVLRHFGETEIAINKEDINKGGEWKIRY